MREWLLGLLGPVGAQELLRVAQRPSHFAHRVLFGSMLLTLVLVRLSWTGAGQGAVALETAAVFRTFSWLQYVGVYLFVPAIVCGAIANERETGSLDLLRISRLSDWEIVVGKLASRIIVTLLLLVSMAPVLGLLMALGGIDPAFWLHMQASAVIAAVLSASVTIYFSVVSDSAVAALMRSYAWIAAWFVVVPFGIGLILGIGEPTADFCPWVAFAIIFEGFSDATPTTPPPGFLFALRTALFPMALSVLLVWLAAKRLGAERASPVRTGAERRAPLFRWRRDRGDRTVKTTLFGRRVDNPLWTRAQLVRVYDRHGYLVRTAWVAVLLALTAMVFTRIAGSGRIAAGWIYIIHSMLSTCVAIVLGASSIAGERRTGALEMVLMTPLDAKEILDGTLLAIWQRARWLLAARVLGISLFLLIFHDLAFPPQASHTALVIFAALLWMPVGLATDLMIGVMSSLPARTTLRAATPAILGKLFVGNIGLFMMAGSTLIRTLIAIPLVVAFTLLAGRTRSSVVLVATFALVSLLSTGIPTLVTDALPQLFGISIVAREFSRQFAELVAALLVTAWAYRWCLRHFDRLVRDGVT